MEFDNNAFIIGVNLRDIEQGPQPQTIFAEIILIDRTNDTLNPLLYELRRESQYGDDDFSGIHNYSLTSIHNDAFAMVGEVITIDKTKKQIYLRNEITVKYNYLIMASGLKQTLNGSAHDEELSSALQTLIEALRVSKNFTTVFETPTTSPLRFPRNTPQHQLKPSTRLAFQSIEKILTQHISPQSNQSLDMMLTGSEKRLYELQL